MAWLAVVGMWMIEGSYLPQLWRLYRLKDAKDFSLWFPLMNFLGRLCAVIYTFHRGDMVLALGFMCGMGLRAALFVQVVYYKGRTKRMLQMESQYAEAMEPETVEREEHVLDDVVLVSEVQGGGLVSLEGGMIEGRV